MKHIAENAHRYVIVYSIGDGAFSGCASLTSVTIPDSVTTVGYQAFSACISLTNVTIGNGLTSIGQQAFSGCTGLTNVTIPDSGTSIGKGAFSSCTNLTGVYFIGNAPRLGSSAFYGDTNAIVYYRPGTTGWGASFGGRSTALWYRPVADWTYAFNTDGTITITGGCTNGEVVIPDTIGGLLVTSIGYQAFAHCTSLTNVTIPDSVTMLARVNVHDTWKLRVSTGDYTNTC